MLPTLCTARHGVWSKLQAEFDYAPLRDALAAGDFQKADDITRAALIQLAGPGAVKRNWVYFTGDSFSDLRHQLP